MNKQSLSSFTGKLLIVVGPTATGKTKLAFGLAKKFNGVPISADSRQVYKYMDIGTGKEGKMLGYDLVLPNEDFSVSQYVKFANSAIDKINVEKKLPILVGGTGLYIKAIIEGIETIDIPPDNSLRLQYANISVEELFNILRKVNSNKANSMNESDRKNPRRLVRAIEITRNSNFKLSNPNIKKYDDLWIGLSAPFDTLKERINKRVEERIKASFENEIKFLKDKGFWEKIPSKTLGYKDWPDIEKWKQEELSYAKRQMTWFKKNKKICWFDISKPNFDEEVEELTEKWYSDQNGKKN